MTVKTNSETLVNYILLLSKLFFMRMSIVIQLKKTILES